ncbi:MAG: hypothetical protein KA257_07090 [Opitutaceae bacterium]|nr:hypothetical protein [Opitutaceae bacterium]
MDGSLTRTLSNSGLLTPPLPAKQIAQWTVQAPPDSFFSNSTDGLLEICVRPIPLETETPQQNWLMTAQLWDAAHLAVLSNLTDGRATLEADPAKTAVTSTAVIHSRPLKDWQGQPVCWLQIAYPSPAAGSLLLNQTPQTRLFFAFGLLLVVAFGLSLHRWVLRPLSQISASLASGEAAPIAKLHTTNDELGSVARLVVTSFAQRDSLQSEIAERRKAEAALIDSETNLRRTLDERTQLGRDLHDGVIQSLYATGMGLSGIRALLKPDQTEAAARLEQSREALNQTIHDVRNFITGLEPEALREQTFSQAVSALLEFMQNIRPAEMICAIDEIAAARLTLFQRANILHITREAVSNALRHGAAQKVHVTLHTTPAGGAVLSIDDDGHGFSKIADQGNNGHGLENFAGRANEISADFTMHSAPGRGTRLTFTFTPPKLHDL